MFSFFVIHNSLRRLLNPSSLYQNKTHEELDDIVQYILWVTD